MLSEGRGRNPRSSRLAFSGVGPLALESKRQQPRLRLSWAAAPKVQLLLHEQGLMEEGGVHRSTPLTWDIASATGGWSRRRNSEVLLLQGRKPCGRELGEGELCVPQAAAVWGGVSILLS